MLRCTLMLAFNARVSCRVAVSIAGAALSIGCGAPDAAADPSAGDTEVAGPGSTAPTPGPDDPAAESEPTPPAAGVYRGTYFVPVPPELEPYARFELESVRLELRGDELGLQYDLPELLLGEARGLSFRGRATDAGEYRLVGDDGVAICRPSSSRWRCDEVLNDVALDARKIDRLLASLPDPEAQGRRGVADRFTIDPIGVLEVELSPRP